MVSQLQQRQLEIYDQIIKKINLPLVSRHDTTDRISGRFRVPLSIPIPAGVATIDDELTIYISIWAREDYNNDLSRVSYVQEWILPVLKTKFSDALLLRLFAPVAAALKKISGNDFMFGAYGGEIYADGKGGHRIPLASVEQAANQIAGGIQRDAALLQRAYAQSAKNIAQSEKQIEAFPAPRPSSAGLSTLDQLKAILNAVKLPAAGRGADRKSVWTTFKFPVFAPTPILVPGTTEGDIVHVNVMMQVAQVVPAPVVKYEWSLPETIVDMAGTNLPNMQLFAPMERFAKRFGVHYEVRILPGNLSGPVFYRPKGEFDLRTLETTEAAAQLGRTLSEFYNQYVDAWAAVAALYKANRVRGKTAVMSALGQQHGYRDVIRVGWMRSKNKG